MSSVTSLGAGDRDLEYRSSVARSIAARTPREVEEATCARELRLSGVRIAEALGMPERVGLRPGGNHSSHYRGEAHAFCLALG